MVLGQMGISKAVLKYSIEIDTQIRLLRILLWGENLVKWKPRHKHGDYEGWRTCRRGN